MARHIAAVVVAVCIGPAWAGAQTPTMTVTASSADVYAAPSTASRTIGEYSRACRP